jgi:hypothetical protein
VTKCQVGVARLIAHGQAMIMTATAPVNAALPGRDDQRGRDHYIAGSACSNTAPRVNQVCSAIAFARQ